MRWELVVKAAIKFLSIPLYPPISHTHPALISEGIFPSQATGFDFLFLLVIHFLPFPLLLSPSLPFPSSILWRQKRHLLVTLYAPDLNRKLVE